VKQVAALHEALSLLTSTRKGRCALLLSLPVGQPLDSLENILSELREWHPWVNCVKLVVETADALAALQALLPPEPDIGPAASVTGPVKDVTGSVSRKLEPLMGASI